MTLGCFHIGCTNAPTEHYCNKYGKVFPCCDEHIPDSAVRDTMTGNFYSPCDHCERRDLFDSKCEFCQYYR